MSQSPRAPALSVSVTHTQVVVTVPAAYRLWPDPPRHQVTIRWGCEGLIAVDLPGQPVVMLSAPQRERLQRSWRERPGIPLVMVDHSGLYRLQGRLSDAGAVAWRA